ncbi:glycosyltransferase [Bacillus sp. RG28]|uniref:Glycosyltransferase n=1 Tax=Gottfriedia endophytica TaxID=2820819 RepID=A0A940SFX5_9BACI|nr:glycosyltransferase [Gottfriedia endophytica]MBP0724472.1 glycosyltransferase [Gottfriedia endophytica]
MKKILLERTSKSYLPQIDATIKYFNGKNLGFRLFDSYEIKDIKLNEFDCLWKFMGIDTSRNIDIPIIHEYPSLSTGIFPKLKNKLKKSITSKPHLRIFLNEYVKEEMGFNDQIEYVYRDVGVDDQFFQYKESVKKYDCVYVGSISKARGIPQLLDQFKYKYKNLSLLLVGTVPDEIYNHYSNCDNITFTGNLPYEDVPKYASQAVYGINYMPNKYPYNLQTSTKLLEYLAMDLQVITTDYFWINHFMKENQLNFIKINENLDNLETLMKSHEIIPNQFTKMEKFKWTNIIEQSGLEEKLLKLI